MTWVSKDDDPLANIGGPSTKTSKKKKKIEQPIVHSKALPPPKKLSKKTRKLLAEKERLLKEKERILAQQIARDNQDTDDEFEETEGGPSRLKVWGGWLIGLFALASLITFYFLGVI